MYILNSKLVTALKVMNTLPCNITELSKKAGMTFSHLTIILNSLEEDGFITSNKNGRDRDFILTKKGENLKGTARKMAEILGLNIK